METLSSFLDKISEFLASRKGLLPLIGLLLVILNFALRLLVPDIWMSSTDFLLHIGLVLAILGFMLAWAL